MTSTIGRHSAAPPMSHRESADRPRSPLLTSTALALIALPLPIGTFRGVQLAIGDLILIALGVPALLTSQSRQARRFLVLLTLGTLSVGAMAVFRAATLGEVVHSMLSLGFFGRCTLGFFIGWRFADRTGLAAPLARVVRQAALFGSILLILVEVSNLLNPQPIRVWSAFDRFGFSTTGWNLTTNVFGLPLYAQFGVNTLAVSVMLLGALSAIALTTPAQLTRHELAYRLVVAAGLASAIHLTLLSQSRQAIAGGFVFGAIALIKLVARSRSDRSLQLAAIAALSVAISTALLAVPGLLPLGRIGDLLASLSTLELDATGRGQLFRIQLDQLRRYPLFGSGFNAGGELFAGEGIVSSAHNQWLGAAVNGGLLFLMAFIAVVGSCLAPLLRSRDRGEVLVASLAIAVIGFVGMVADPLTVAPIGGTLFVLAGIHAGQRSRAVSVRPKQ